MNCLMAQGRMEQGTITFCSMHIGSAQKLLENRNAEIAVDCGAEGTGGHKVEKSL